jgi:hypothetical protein
VQKGRCIPAFASCTKEAKIPISNSPKRKRRRQKIPSFLLPPAPPPPLLFRRHRLLRRPAGPLPFHRHRLLRRGTCPCRPRSRESSPAPRRSPWGQRSTAAQGSSVAGEGAEGGGGQRGKPRRHRLPWRSSTTEEPRRPRWRSRGAHVASIQLCRRQFKLHRR